MPGIPSPDPDFAVTAIYVLPDDAWHLELDHLPSGGITVLAGIVPDEDPEREPSVWAGGIDPCIHIPVPVLRWFLELVDAQIAASRAWMQLRPELVVTIKELIDEYRGAIDDDEYAVLLARLRAELPPADVAEVVRSAFRREYDLT
ncbi:hypothetical protein [Kitasatospora griseola]|uniref:hypothetical protein n=1 Tax=Kitasatospora griseola TaxID=2064 RepID=UPI001E2B20F7|nr:hypothetical protein [Kitasatospora griseola]